MKKVSFNNGINAPEQGGVGGAKPLNQPPLGATVTMRKTHPCGSNLFTLIRTGADVKIRCNSCGRIITMDLLEFSKAVKNWTI